MNNIWLIFIFVERYSWYFQHKRGSIILGKSINFNTIISYDWFHFVDFMMYLVLSRWIFLLCSRSWLVFSFFSNSSNIRCWLSSVDPTVLFILLNSSWFEHLMLLISSLIWFVSVLLLFSNALSFSLTLFSFSSNISLFLRSNLFLTL